MFSGITQGLFPVTQVVAKHCMLDYVISLNDQLTQKLKIGSSLSVDGVCQTVTQIRNTLVSFTAMEETLSRTTLQQLYEGRRVSIEPSLRYGDEIGGHLLSGHVSGTAEVATIDQNQENLSITFKCAPEWMKYILPKGFIAVDGSSLTIGNIDSSGFFKVHLIPETVRVTHFGNKKIGDLVNIELDQQTVAIVNNLELLKTKILAAATH